MVPLYNPVTGSGGGSPLAVEVVITDGAVQDLASTASWIIAETSVGTDLAATIPASAGEHIRVVGRFLRSGAHFLDWAALAANGTVHTYLASGTGSPLAEGDPALYPSTSFMFSTGDPVFTVQAAQVNNGNVTVALAHQGQSSGRVYAYSGYPFKLRLENLDRRS